MMLQKMGVIEREWRKSRDRKRLRPREGVGKRLHPDDRLSVEMEILLLKVEAMVDTELLSEVFDGSHCVCLVSARSIFYIIQFICFDSRFNV